LDRERIRLVVSQIAKQDVSLGDVLTELADVSAYTPIFQALQSSKMRSAEATA
jgi:hypothetical protein